MAIAERNIRILDATGKPIKSDNPFPTNVINTPDINQIVKNVNINWPANLQTLFSRVRVAGDETQVSFKQDNPLKNIILTEGQVSGTGSSSNFAAQSSIDQASTLMTVGTSVALRRLRTRNAGLYIAGNGLLCLFTFCLESPGQANVVKRAGYFDDQDGVFFEQDGTTLSW